MLTKQQLQSLKSIRETKRVSSVSLLKLINTETFMTKDISRLLLSLRDMNLLKDTEKKEGMSYIYPLTEFIRALRKYLEQPVRVTKRRELAKKILSILEVKDEIL